MNLFLKDPTVKGKLLLAIDKAVPHGRFMLGPQVDQPEK